MNTEKKNRLFELFTAHAADTLTPEEHEELQAVLRSNAEARQLWFVHQDVEMGLRAHLAADPIVPNQTPPLTARRTAWLQWRPLTAAAAGVMFGMLCTSMVFGFVVPRGGERAVPLAILEPGFEDPQMPLAKDFPNTSTRWGGDEASVVKTENGVQPKEGQFMLRLEPALRGSPRVFQVLDLESLPQTPASGMRQIEIEASFAPSDAEASVRFLIRAFAVSEAPALLDADWFDQRDEAISSAMIGLDGVRGDSSWQTFGLRVQVPPTARSLVLFFGVRTPDKSLPKAANYIDDVRVSLIEPQPLP